MPPRPPSHYFYLSAKTPLFQHATGTLALTGRRCGRAMQHHSLGAIWNSQTLILTIIIAKKDLLFGALRAVRLRTAHLKVPLPPSPLHTSAPKARRRLPLY